jgi:hypothetical protein
MTRRWQLFLAGAVGVMWLWVAPAEQPALPIAAASAFAFGGPLGWTLHDYQRRWRRWTKKVGLR